MDKITIRALKKAVADTSISDKKFFKMLLKYLSDQEIKDQKSNKDISSINSPEFQKREAKTDRLRKLVEKMRPEIDEMMGQYVLKQHEYCCGPKSKK